MLEVIEQKPAEEMTANASFNREDKVKGRAQSR